MTQLYILPEMKLICWMAFVINQGIGSIQTKTKLFCMQQKPVEMIFIPLELSKFYTTTNNEGSVSQSPSVELLMAHFIVFLKV